MSESLCFVMFSFLFATRIKHQAEFHSNWKNDDDVRFDLNVLFWNWRTGLWLWQITDF